MGVRIDAYAVDLPKFASFLETTIGDLLRRYQLDGMIPDERLMFTDIHNDDTFFATPGGSIGAWLGNGPDRHSEELTDARIHALDVLQRPAHEHLSRGSIYQSSWLLRGFSNCRGVDFIERLIDGHRRWWIGSVLQFAHSHLDRSEYEELENLFCRVLRRADCGFTISETDPGFVTAGLPFTPDDDLDLQFGRWSQRESSAAVTLLSKMMELSPTFTRPPGPIGIAPEDAEWHEWVFDNVKSLLRISSLNYSTCNVLTFIG
jgi:hypothetical protein